LGVVADQVGETETAIRLITKAIEHGPEDPSCFNDLGNAFVNHGNPQEALSCFRKALKLNPNLAGAHNNMGHVLVKQIRIAEGEAISCFQKAAELKPDCAEAYAYMGMAFKHYGKVNEAIASYRKSLEIKPDFAEVYGELFHQYQRTCAWQELEGLQGGLAGLCCR
jgi:protein O-GlcNAc transferase